jgi:hypothetical protein
LFAATPFLVKLGLVRRLAPRDILPHVFIHRLLHNRLYVHWLTHNFSFPVKKPSG